MNQTAIVWSQVLCQLNCLRAPYSNDTNIVVSDPPSNQSPLPVQPTTLPDGYIAYPEIDTAYKIIFNAVRWSEAREQCDLEGAHLAILDSQRKLDLVQNTTRHTHHRTSGYIQIHTGIYLMDEKWVDLSTGKTLSALPWHLGYPLSSSGDCATADIITTGTSYLQNGNVCNSKLFYLCEVPIPTAYKTQENQMARISVN